MNRLLRPSLLVFVSAGLALVAGALMLWPRDLDRAQPLPVTKGDCEIVWLNYATNSAAWERFVAAVRRARPGALHLEVDDSKAFPNETTEVPELKVGVRGKQGRLLFRWYKLTGDLKTSDWVAALMQRDPPPLAVIGGSNSESGLELARQLQDKCHGPDRPLYLITQATSDKDTSKDTSDPSEPLLISIYPERTFRFCFTNRQMAVAVTDFVWNRDNLLRASDPLRQVNQFLWGDERLPPADDCLRPDGDPAYMAIWNDDPYSKDLADHFIAALRVQAVRTTALDFAWVSGFAGAGGVPIDMAGVRRGQFRMAQSLPWQKHIFHSVGGFNRPNQAEEDVADSLLLELAKYREAHNGQDQLRPLLVLPATSQPCRRFLRALRINAPVVARRFTVVTGDSIEFNKIYRDRNLTWPIQEVPLKLVFFCHRNPVDRDVGFREEDAPDAGSDYDQGSSTTGTEDLLLYIDIVETVVKGCYQGPRLLRNATELAANLHEIRWKNSRTLFGPEGNRHGGTGEHVVYLRPPQLVNGRVAPRAEIEVWSRSPPEEGTRRKPWALQRFLTVTYNGPSGEGR
jgi:hypothetical protein